MPAFFKTPPVSCMGKMKRSGFISRNISKFLALSFANDWERRRAEFHFRGKRCLFSGAQPAEAAFSVAKPAVRQKLARLLLYTKPSRMRRGGHADRDPLAAGARRQGRPREGNGRRTLGFNHQNIGETQ